MAPPLIFPEIGIGLLVGTLVGMTGLGGAMLLLPLLIFGLGVPPIIAVGTDAVFNFITKLGAGYVHGRQGSVRWNIVWQLASGSIPGVILGVFLLAQFRSFYGNEVNSILKLVIGVLLVVIPTLLLFQRRIKRAFHHSGDSSRSSHLRIAAIGLLGGVLVGMTSVGSGSIIMMLLIVACNVPASALVGTDIAHAIFLTGMAALLHLRLGTVDLPLVASLLIGSIPGALLGSRMSTRVPVHWLRWALFAILFASGVRMLAP